MELQRGSCTLCAESSRVLSALDVEELCNVLPSFYEHFLPESEFQKIKKSLKICSACCYKMQFAAETKRSMEKCNQNNDKDKNLCRFCKTDKCLIKLDKTWKNITEKTEGYVDTTDFPVCACPKCVFYFDVIFNFKSKLLYKFPYLAVPKRKTVTFSPKPNETPKRKPLLKSPPSPKKRKVFDTCFTYLQPLCNSDDHVDEELKNDIKLYKKIPYVDLKNEKDVNIKKSPKMRPVIKIKLKPRGKKNELLKSEELDQSERPKMKRRHSIAGTKKASEGPEEKKLDETPKSAIVSNTVPRRRVSLYINNSENETVSAAKTDDKETTVETEEKEKTSRTQEKKEAAETEEKVSDTEEKDESAETEEKDETAETTCEETKEMIENVSKEVAVSDSEESKESVDLAANEENKSDTENHENDDSSDVSPREVVNGDTSEDVEDQEDQNKKSEDPVLIESDSSYETTQRSEKEDSDIETDDKSITRELSDLDVTNGSERKKKRVTFSDDILD